MTEVTVDGLRSGAALMFLGVCVVWLALFNIGTLLGRIAIALEAMIPSDVDPDIAYDEDD